MQQSSYFVRYTRFWDMNYSSLFLGFTTWFTIGLDYHSATVRSRTPHRNYKPNHSASLNKRTNYRRLCKQCILCNKRPPSVPFNPRSSGTFSLDQVSPDALTEYAFTISRTVFWSQLHALRSYWQSLRPSLQSPASPHVPRLPNH